MIRIMLCCGGGFSSSALAARIQKDILVHHLEDKVSIDFEPFMFSKNNYNQYDIIICCPHLTRQIPDYNKKHIHNQVPIYVLPPLQYGVATAENVYEDALDVIEAFQKNPVNPFCFPGEENVFKNRRRTSWRKAHPHLSVTE